MLAGRSLHANAVAHFAERMSSVRRSAFQASWLPRLAIAGRPLFGQAEPHMNQDIEDLAGRAAPALFVMLWSTGFIGTKYVLHDAEPLTYLAIRMVLVVGLMALIAAIARPQWPDRRGIAHSVVAGMPGARILSGRHRDRDRAFDSGRTVGADPGPAADPDLDPGQSLARRARHAAAMGRAAARARRRGADPARSPDERGGGLGLARLGRLAGQHHAGDVVPAPLLQPHRLARRQSRAVHRGRRFSSPPARGCSRATWCAGPASSCCR